MQVCNVNVRLGGDLRFQVPKTGVTPAEILVLRHLQSAEDAVADIVVTGDEPRNMHAEMDRLCTIYDEKKVRELFPGAHPRLPVSLDEINVMPKADVSAAAVPEKPAPRQRRPRQAQQAPTGEPVSAAERQDASDSVGAGEAQDAGEQYEELGGDPPTGRVTEA